MLLFLELWWLACCNSFFVPPTSVFMARGRVQITLRSSFDYVSPEWRAKLHLSNEDVAKMYRRAPTNMLFYRQSDVMNGAGMKELERIGLNEDELSRMAVNWPQLLSSHNVARVVEFLVTRLQLNEGELRKMVLTMPSLLGHNIDTLESKIAFLTTRLLLDETQLRKMVLTMPSLLGHNIDTLESKMAFLTTRLLLDETQLRKMVLAMPQLFGYNIESNIEPTISFFEETMGLEAARNFIISFALCLSYSLSKRLIPRFDRLLQSHKTTPSASDLVLEKTTSGNICRLTNDKFDAWMGRNHGEQFTENKDVDETVTREYTYFQ